ncbi:MAG: NnrS family protein [Candidatus Eremiobacteraeota bacterium]|nr:NnrS family protein [Candidatus Eremiobacteraeota bacterium]MCW5871036.1 NnrS family protein [Candidatus Eremiobacteraeota bacterium]
MMQLRLRILDQDPVVAPRPAQAAPGRAWLAYGFRPFFLAGSGAAAGLMLLWLWLLAGRGIVPSLDPIQWHAHEMLFGFGGAVVAGFLLTAVPNWTGLPTPKDAPLGALLAVWLLGRLGSWWGGAGALLDLLFLPALGFSLAGPLWRAGQLRNLIFLPVLGLLWLANVLFWSGSQQRPLALSLAVYGMLLLIALVGGRVIPFFTERALDGHQPLRLGWLEVLCLAGLVLSVLVENLPGISGFSKLAVLGPTAFFHCVRLLGWGSWRIVRVPLLWVLYLGYAFLPLGLLLRGLAWSGWGSLSAATHALTAGCIALMCLGMMARVALGHTGRELKPARVTVVSFGLLAAAAVCRSLLPFGWPQLYSHALWCSGILWCLAFLLHFTAYWPVLTRPRVDGKPG